VAAPVVVAPSASRAQLFTPQRYVGPPIRLRGVHAPLTLCLVSTLKEKLRADLTAAMKSRDELVKATLRMTLTAIGVAEVAGTEARQLDDAEVQKVIAKEAKKRAESAEAFAAAGRDELAAKERAEGEVLAGYLPKQLTDDELAIIARIAVDETATELGEQPSQRQMGLVMKRAGAAVAGRADGGRVAAAVKALLSS
jgi:uncharacterized protein YqeY